MEVRCDRIQNIYFIYIHLVGILKKCLTFVIIFTVSNVSFVSFNSFTDASKFCIVFRNHVMAHFPQVRTPVHLCMWCSFNFIAQKMLLLWFQQNPVHSKSANLIVSENVFLKSCASILQHHLTAPLRYFLLWLSLVWQVYCTKVHFLHWES